MGWVLCRELSLLTGKGTGSELASLPRQDSSTSLPRTPAAAQLHGHLRPRCRVCLSEHCRLRLRDVSCLPMQWALLFLGHPRQWLPGTGRPLPGAQPGSDGCRACQAWGLLTPWLWHSHPEGSKTPSGSALAGSPVGSGCPPRCWHSPYLPPGLFHVWPGTQGYPVSYRVSWTLAQAEPLAPTAAVLARGSPDRCWGDL